MKQLLQNPSSRDFRVVDVPVPRCLAGGVLVRNVASLISSGTERASIRLGSKSLLGKATERPDLVRQVFERVRKNGFADALSAVRARIDADIPLGYSSAGIILEVGEGAAEFAPNERVACAGTGFANHAEIVWVPKNLCAKIPPGIDFESAAAAALGAIALQSLRVAEVKIGERVAVIGLGLVGLLAVQILKGAGCSVVGIDPNPERVELARRLGADRAYENRILFNALGSMDSPGQAADAVIVAASTRSTEPVHLAGKLARDRGVVVIVGDVTVDVPREPYYKKELQLRYSRSYGPGRYDPSYEEGGIDYPRGFVRWTEKRNLEAFLDLIARRKVLVAPLITHRFPIEEGCEAYKLLSGATGQKYVGIVLSYRPDSLPTSRVATGDASSSAELPLRSGIRRNVRLGWIGAGVFSRAKLLPQLAKIRDVERIGLASARGISARNAARRFQFRYCSADPIEVLGDPAVDAVFIATPHHLHASLIVSALECGKHVFVEKPLCVSDRELERIAEAYGKADRLLVAGFNRRFSPFAQECAKFFASRTGPLSLIYRVCASRPPREHWARDPRQGHGPIIGEICHFVDLIQFLTASVPVEAQAWPIAGPGDEIEDNLHVHLALADGSQAEIVYLTCADRGVPKERVEISGEGRTAICEDFKKWHFLAGGRRHTTRLVRRNKGHREEMSAFVAAVATGASGPIPFESLCATTLATFRIRDSLRSGKSFPVHALGVHSEKPEQAGTLGATRWAGETEAPAAQMGTPSNGGVGGSRT